METKNSDSQDYYKWLQKFEAKKTTDDTFTPPKVYDAVKDWVLNEYADSVKELRATRPFYPGGDFTAADYSGKVVIDNPPFSILSKIVKFYEQRDIKYFLFAPSLTLFSPQAKTSIITDSDIKYANGAIVKTAFVTNLDDSYAVRTAPDLSKAIEAAKEDEAKMVLPKYKYPDNLITAAGLQKLAKVDLRIEHSEVSEKIGALDSQRPKKKTIFGGGLLITDKAAAEVKAAKEVIVWELSDRERMIIKGLETGGNNRCAGGQMNKLKILEQWQSTSEALNKASDHLLEFGMSIESETVSAIHDAMDQMTKLASAAVGDAFEVLSWYQYDNAMGALGLQVTANNEAREIRTLEDLLWSMQ